MKSDEIIVKEVQAGTKDSFAEIINRYEGKILGFSLRMLRDRALAEDATQETFLKSYQNIQSFDLSRNFSSWIFRIAHNEVINIFRHYKNISGSDDLIETIGDDFENKIQEELDLVTEKEELAKAVNTLPVKFKEAIDLKFFQEKSYEEISEIMRIPIGTVGTYINRAKQNLREKLRKEKQDE